MKTKRTFASLCLALSCCALITASNVSVGDQPGVVRLTSGQQSFDPPAPVPPVAGESAPAPTQTAAAPMPTYDYGAQMASPGYEQGAPVYEPMMQEYPVEDGGMQMGPYGGDYSPYFESSGVTEASGYRRTPHENPLFGPQLMFETNIDNGLGFNEAYHSANVRLPYHVVPGNSVLIGDISASLTNNGNDLYNFGLIWRNYDAMRNRVFGWNAYFDMDDGRGNSNWKRVGVGIESLGKYIDFRANGYHVTGADSFLLNDSLIGDLTLGGNNVFRIRNQTRDNAYSGADVEVGGPLPVLGRRGINAYVGGYYLDNDMGHETVGFSSRIEALITESATVNVHYTNDDTFGVNSWVSIAYTLPNYGERTILQPRCVRDRLADPVVRSNRIHSNIDVVDVPEAVINAKTGSAYNIVYVNPNSTLTGIGTLESPYSSLAEAEANNNAGIDIIRVTPRLDDTTTNLTVNGGIDLFECQTLLSSTKDFTLFTENNMNFIIPGVATDSNLGPLISNPTIGAADSVIRLTNGNSIVGMRVDASNADSTVFGTGISNALPFTDASIICNTFTNYETAVNLQNGSGRIVFDENTATGVVDESNDGLILTTATGSAVELLIRNNTVDNSRFTDATGTAVNGLNNSNTRSGINVTANAGSTLNADDPNGVSSSGPTGITANTVSNSGDGIVVTALAGATVNLVAEANTSSNNNGNGFVGTANGAGARFNLFSLRGNTFDANRQNGAFLHYHNGGTFFALSEDLNDDLDFSGLQDNGEGVGANGVFDVADGILGAGEGFNQNGLLDQGIVSNIFSNNGIAGLCLFGEDTAVGLFDIGGPTAELGNDLRTNTSGGIVADLQGFSRSSINATNNRTVAAVAQGGNVLRTGFTQNTLAANDDQSTGLVPIGFDANFFGTQFTDLFVNNNGNVTFDFPLFTFTPFNLLSNSIPIIAPFFGDVDTRLGTEVTYGNGIVNGRNAFGVNYQDVRHFSTFSTSEGLPANSFQMVLIDRSDIGAGDFDIEFNYDSILWEAGEASGSDVNGLGGSTARVGFSNGSTTSFELPGSAVPGAFLDSGPAATSLVQNSLNSGVLGRYVFEARNGSVSTSQNASVNADAVRVSLIDDAVLTNAQFINNTLNSSAGDGIEINAGGRSVVQNLNVQGNQIQNSSGNGLRISADGPAATINARIGGLQQNVLGGVSFSEANDFSNNGGDGLSIFAANGGVIRGSVVNNLLVNNGSNGLSLLSENGTLDFGTLPDRVITNNTITDNNGIGIELVSNASVGMMSRIDAIVRNNTISNNTGGGVISTMGGTSAFGVTNNEVNLVLGGTASQSNVIEDNTVTGVSFGVAGNAKGTIDLRNASVTNSNGDGITLTRSGSSLLTATIENVTSTGHTGSGLVVDVQGNDKTDLNQPMSGTINTVSWNNNNFSDNGQDGARFIVRGDAQLIADGENNQTTGNVNNGVAITTSENASFGDATDGVPPGRRVRLNGTNASNNGLDGFSITATENSRVLVNVTSERTAATTVGAHAGANVNGDTNISGNGREGIHVTTTGGSSDILVSSTTGTTTISGNGGGDRDGVDANGDGILDGDGVVDGGSGIRWDASGSSDGTVRVTGTDILGHIAGPQEDVTTNGNGILDAGEDINGNGILDTGEDGNDDVDVVGGDGIQYNVFGNATATLVVGGAGVGDGNRIQNNGDDGIAISATGAGANISRPVISIVGNTIGGSRNGVDAGNGGDGLSVNILGGTAASGNASGPILQMTATDNLISNNTGRGVNLLVTGAAGERDRENGNSGFDPVRVTLTGNTIATNGTEGIFFRGDSEMNQGRFTTLGNTGFPGDDRTQAFAFYDPNQPQFLAGNVGSVNGNTAFSTGAPDGALAYLNLRTVQNSFLTVVGNTVQNNGVGTVSGEGVVLSVGTGSYLAADVRNNIFGGNLEEDFRTESFLSFGNTTASIDTTGVGTVDTIFHDDSAQLDMRFLGNTGNQIALSSTGATYTNADALKQIALGVVGVQDRDAAFFQVDDGGNLDNPNNSFINFGITQDIDGAFATGGFNLRGAADGAFPNIGFAPFLP